MTDKLRTHPTDEMNGIALRRKGGCEFSGDVLTNHPHRHSYEICYVLEGRGVQIHGDQTIAVSRDDIFLAEAGIEHEVTVLPGGYLQVYYFVFDIVQPPETIDPAGVLSRFRHNHALKASGQGHLRPLIKQVRNYLAMGPERSPWVESTSQIFLLDAMNALCDCAAPSAAFEHPAMIKALEYIQENLSRKLKLDDIAFAAGTSPRNLQLLFRRHRSKSVMEVVNIERCNLASQYLDMGFRVSQAGPIIGIDDAAQFSRFYKRYTGVNPTDRRSRGA